MFQGKKAAGDAISALILFIAVVAISTGIVIAMKNYALETQESFNTQSDVINNQLKTSIDITNIVYDSATNTTYVYLKNIGNTKLITQDFDFFINDEYIFNYSVFQADNLSVQLDVQLIQQTAVFVKEKYLAAGSHEVKLVSGYGGSGDTDYFNN